jgi:putative proteasome-type protease
MTYCVALKIKSGLVFLSDSRTNAGMDNFFTFRKMSIYEDRHTAPGSRRVMSMLSAGNLAISQAVRQTVKSQTVVDSAGNLVGLWNCRSLYDAARIVGESVRTVQSRDGDALARSGVDFNSAIIFGGQIEGEPMRLFNIYSAGNFIEATYDHCYFQIGEAKYGKPILDRVITPDTPLDEAAKCALISMDSTLKSNLSVGLPLDLLVYEADSFHANSRICIDEHNPYFQLVRETWGAKLREVFTEIEDPQWRERAGAHPLVSAPTGHSDILLELPPLQ